MIPLTTLHRHESGQPYKRYEKIDAFENYGNHTLMNNIDSFRFVLLCIAEFFLQCVYYNVCIGAFFARLVKKDDKLTCLSRP